MVTTRYSDQQGSKSRQKVMRLYKRWHRPIAKRFIKLPLLHIEKLQTNTEYKSRERASNLKLCVDIQSSNRNINIITVEGATNTKATVALQLNRKLVLPFP